MTMEEPFSRDADTAGDSDREQRRFRVLDRQAPEELEERKIPKELTVPQGFRKHQTDCRHYLYVLGDAARDLFSHIGWGDRTSENVVEQGGLLLGRVYRDPERRIVYGVVARVVPAVGAHASTTLLEFTPDVWGGMLDELDDSRGHEGTVESRVIGWYHTHPNHLDVFMSGTDRTTQEKFFDQEWHFALVLNPHRRKLEAFHGATATPCNVRVDPSQVMVAGESETDLRERGQSSPFTESPVDHAEEAVAGPPRGAYWVKSFLQKLMRWRRRRVVCDGFRFQILQEDREGRRVMVRVEGWIKQDSFRCLVKRWLRG